MSFLIKHFAFLLFGFLQIFFSAPGQTFLIALFVAPIFDEMNVSQTLFASIYSFATLGAALFLNPIGRIIDKTRPEKLIVFLCSSMALGAFVLASSQNLIVLFLGFFILRLIGQGAFGLTATTLSLKIFNKNKGKALGIINQGWPLSELVFPVLTLWLLSMTNWRITYIIFGISFIFLMMPLQLFLLKKSNIEKGKFIDDEPLEEKNISKTQEKEQKQFLLNEVFKDVKFYFLLFAAGLPPAVITGLFFHQTKIFEENSWDISFIATGMAVYAFCKSSGSLTIGYLVDKIGPMIPFVTLIALIGLSCLLGSWGGSELIVYCYYITAGLSLGFNSPVSNVVWPQFYGTEHLGSIKGMFATFRNGLTAFAPLPMAMALDAGISIQTVLEYMAYGSFMIALFPIIIYNIKES